MYFLSVQKYRPPFSNKIFLYMYLTFIYLITVWIRWPFILSNIPQNWIVLPSLPFGSRKILKINSSECWTVSIPRIKDHHIPSVLCARKNTPSIYSTWYTYITLCVVWHERKWMISNFFQGSSLWKKSVCGPRPSYYI